MGFVKAGRYQINPAQVSHMTWDHRHHMNGSDAALTITMVNGCTFSVKHEPNLMNGADAYAIERAILAGMKKAWKNSGATGTEE